MPASSSLFCAFALYLWQTTAASTFLHELEETMHSRSVHLSEELTDARRKLMETAPEPCVIRDPANCQTVWEFLSSNVTEYSYYMDAAKAVGAVGALQCTDLRATLFVPNNNAWLALFSAYNLAPQQLFTATATLNAVLRYHMLPGRVTPVQLGQQSGFITLPQQNLTISSDGSSMFLSGNGNRARINLADGRACGAVVYVINKVLIPNFDVVAPAV